MNVVAAATVGLLEGAVLRPFMLLLVTACTCLLLRRASASIRHLVWLIGLSGTLLVPVLTAILPVLRVPVPAALAGMKLTVSAASPGGDVEASSLMGSASLVASEAPTRMFVFSGPWQRVLLLLWLAGALVMLLRLALSVAKVRCLIRNASQVTDATWLDLSRDLEDRLGVKRPVALLTGTGGTVPMTWGTMRPVIWLPPVAREWTPEHRHDVVAHEMAHIRRGDAVTQWISHAAATVYWFNPLVWFAIRRLREEREHACDDAVLRLGAPPVSYAEHLLDVLRSASRSPSPASAMAMARKSGIEQRVRAILDPTVRRESIDGLMGVAMLFAAGVVLLPVATLRPAVTVPAGAEMTGSTLRDAFPELSVTPARRDTTSEVGNQAITAVGLKPDSMPRVPSAYTLGNGPGAAPRIGASPDPTPRGNPSGEGQPTALPAPAPPVSMEFMTASSLPATGSSGGTATRSISASSSASGSSSSSSQSSSSSSP